MNFLIIKFNCKYCFISCHVGCQDVIRCHFRRKMCEKALPLPGYKEIDELFLYLNWEKNSDGTRNLHLRGNELQLRINRRVYDSDVPAVVSFLQKHPEVVKLDLQYNRITDDGFISLAKEVLCRENGLRYLNLARCDITDRGVVYMCKKVPNLRLVELRLHGNKFGQLGGKALANYIEHNEHLEYLDIAETDQTLQSLAYFMQVLNNYHGNNRTLRVLDISRPIPYANNYVENDEQLASMISILLESNRQLVEIHLQKCQLDGHDIERLLVGLRRNETLLFLDVGYNKIGDYGIEHVAKYLDGAALIGLNVAGNGIKDTGARALSVHMPFSRIRLLDISNNKISDSGMLDFLKTVRKWVQIRILNVWGNSIEHESCAVIDRMFKSGTLNPNHVDVCVYELDEVMYAAFNPSDWYKHYYYCQLDYGVALPFRVKKNRVPPKRKMRVDLKYYPSIVGYEAKAREVEKVPSCTCCICESKELKAVSIREPKKPCDRAE